MVRCSDLIQSGVVNARQLSNIAAKPGIDVPADWKERDEIEPLGALQAVVYASLRQGGARHDVSLRAVAGLSLGCDYPNEAAWLRNQFGGYCVAMIDTTIAYVRDPRELPPGPMLVVRLAESVDVVGQAIRAGNRGRAA